MQKEINKELEFLRELSTQDFSPQMQRLIQDEINYRKVEHLS